MTAIVVERATAWTETCVPAKSHARCLDIDIQANTVCLSSCRLKLDSCWPLLGCILGESMVNCIRAQDPCPSFKATPVVVLLAWRFFVSSTSFSSRKRLAALTFAKRSLACVGHIHQSKKRRNCKPDTKPVGAGWGRGATKRVKISVR